MARRFKALSWNIRANCGASAARLARIAVAIESAEADVVMLQEVSSEGTAPTLERHLRAAGFVGWHFTGAVRKGMRYGNAIVSKGRLRPLRWLTSIPFPQLAARALVETSAGHVEVISVHMPNGSTYAWKKIEMFEGLSSLLATDHSTARIIGGDFNEPRRFMRNDAVVSFGADDDGVVRGYWAGFPNHRWQNAVENVLGPRAPLLHTWLATNPGRSQATHVNRGVRRCFFDHLLVSRDHFAVEDSGYKHRWRTGANALSDHSAAWATLRRG